MTAPFSRSYLYTGRVSHKRFSPKRHSFSYSLYMLALDVDDVENQSLSETDTKRKSLGLLGFSWFHPLRFVEKDYLRDEPFPLRRRIVNKVKDLHGHEDIDKVLMLVQVRCFGIYFSPANFYFCYNQAGKCTQMLAEVSNTPWNERHYYLVNLLNDEKVNKKVFQVSPFMDLDMSYVWQVTPPNNIDTSLRVSIENHRVNELTDKNEKLFAAHLLMSRQTLSKTKLLKVWCQLPAMTVKVVFSIYWQALKLFIKRIPFIGYQKAK